MNIAVRVGRLDELHDLEELQRRASLANPGDRDFLLANPDVIVVPARQISDGQVFVAESADGLLGFCTVLDRSDGQTELDGLFVDPRLWRGGVGRQLVARAMQYARERSASWLHVVGNAHAEGFYEACGFVAYGTEQTDSGNGLLMRVATRG